jgi:uncharacterized protein
MLTKELALARIEGVDVIPDRLTRANHAHYLGYAEQMCAVYRSGIGCSRKQLHAAVHKVMQDERDCPPKRIDAFCKLLDERCEYETDESGNASKLRRAVFREAATQQPITNNPNGLFGVKPQVVCDAIAQSHNLSWVELRHRMFLDLIENHTLRSFEDFAGPNELLSRYNVAQTQAALFAATEMTLVIESDFRAILKYAKLARLMHRIARHPDGNGYTLRLDGPASVLQNTSRYGIAMAKFLPGLLSCRGWRFEAKIKKPKFWNLRLRLSSEDGLWSPVPSHTEFDSSIEEYFAKQWLEAETGGWSLERETEFLHHGQTVFFPDFVFRHTDGRRVLMEVIGFWTPEYLAHKREVLRKFGSEKILLAVQESLLSQKPIRQSAVLEARQDRETTESASNVPVIYRTVIPIKQVLDRLDGWK